MDMMDNLLRLYCTLSVNNLPSSFYIGAFLTFIMFMGLMYIFGMRRMVHYSLLLLTVEYVFLIFGSFVVFRSTIPSCGFSLIPFQSYLLCHYCHDELMAQNILNILAFMPIGLLFGSGLSKLVTWPRMLLIGITLSASIEVLQFVLNKGFAELDDIIHNTLGCLIGYGIASFAEKVSLKVVEDCKGNEVCQRQEGNV